MTEIYQRVIQQFRQRYYILMLLIVFGWCIFSRISFVSENFKDSDAARIAFGVGNLLRGVDYQNAYLYRPVKQAGYNYFLYSFCKMILGGQISHIKALMNYASALFGIGILFVSYFLFTNFLSKRVSLLAVFLLSLTPVLWITNLYGNAITMAFFFGILSLYLFIVSGEGDKLLFMSIPAVVLFIAMLFRADMILMLPCFIAYQLLYKRGKVKELLFFIFILASLAFLMYVFILPAHQLSEGFLEYRINLVWLGCFVVFGLSPIIFLLTVVGMGFSLRFDIKLALFLLSWCIPVIVFYAGHCYSPRYLIPIYPPAVLLSCLAIRELYRRLRHNGRYLSSISVLIVLLLAISPTFFSFSLDRGGIHLTWGSKMTYGTADGYHPFGGTLSFAKQVHTQEIEGEENRDITNNEELPIVDDFANSNQSPVYFIGADDTTYLRYYLSSIGYIFVGADSGVVILKKGQTTIRTVSGGGKELIEVIANNRDLPMLITTDALANIGKYQKDFLDSLTLRRVTEKIDKNIYEVTSKANCNDAYHEKLLGEFTNFHRKILVDELDVGNSLSEAKHNYRAESTNTTELKNLPMSNNERIVLTDSGRTIQNYEEFNVSVKKLKDLFIIRRTDCSVEEQTIWIYVDGVKVKEWNITGGEEKTLSHSDCFRDVSIEIPGRYLTSQNIKLRFVNQSKNNPSLRSRTGVTSYAYCFYQRPYSDVLYDLVYVGN